MISDDSKWETEEDELEDVFGPDTSQKVEKQSASYLNGLNNTDDEIDTVFGQLNPNPVPKIDHDDDELSSGAETVSPRLDTKLLNYQHFERDDAEFLFESDLDVGGKLGSNSASRISKQNSLSTSDSDMDDSSSSSSSNGSSLASSDSAASSSDELSNESDDNKQTQRIHRVIRFDITARQIFYLIWL